MKTKQQKSVTIQCTKECKFKEMCTNRPFNGVLIFLYMCVCACIIVHSTLIICSSNKRHSFFDIRLIAIFTQWGLISGPPSARISFQWHAHAHAHAQVDKCESAHWHCDAKKICQKSLYDTSEQNSNNNNKNCPNSACNERQSFNERECKSERGRQNYDQTEMKARIKILRPFWLIPIWTFNITHHMHSATAHKSTATHLPTRWWLLLCIYTYRIRYTLEPSITKCICRYPIGRMWPNWREKKIRKTGIRLYWMCEKYNDIHLNSYCPFLFATRSADIFSFVNISCDLQAQS